MATRTIERTEYLADIIIGAVEGGIGYWSATSAYRHSGDPANTLAVVHEYDDASDTYTADRHEITPDTIAHGITCIRRGDLRNLSDGRRTAILAADRHNDAGDLDSDLCDCIVQVALFGDVVYG
jgi:hypothetical protein